jgi:outer membrane protein assembly factor BamB
VASIDAHELHALDAGSGEPVWRFQAGGRIDSPPTIHGGLALFGCHDGWVYGVAAADGRLAWRFRAAPQERRIVAFDQVESAWPVPGSVLVGNGVLHCVAGRSMFLDGGLRLRRLDPRTGRKLSETVLDDRDPENGKNLQSHIRRLSMPVALPDVLSSDGRWVYMRSLRFDLEGRRAAIPPAPLDDQTGEGAHLFSPIGFLDGSRWHRSYWMVGKATDSGYGGWFRAGRLAPAGSILVRDGDRVYGYGRKPEFFVNTSVVEHQIFATAGEVAADDIAGVTRAAARMNLASAKKAAESSDWRLREGFPLPDRTAVRCAWTREHPSLQVRALVLDGPVLFAAGYPDAVDERRAFRLPDDPETARALSEQAAAVEGKRGGRLWAIAAGGGAVLARLHLPSPPVFDGMASAGGKLYVSTEAGEVLCLGAGGRPLEDAGGEPIQTRSEEPVEVAKVPPPEVSRDADFARTAACSVFASDLGYRLRPAGKGRAGVAVRKLETPLKGNVVIRGKLRSVPGTWDAHLANGFLAFGEGPGDDGLVKCGLRLKQSSAVIVQGPLKAGGTAVSRKVETGGDETFDIRIDVDLGSGKVRLQVRGATLEADLARPMEAITHVGYCVDDAVTDFGPIEATAG